MSRSSVRSSRWLVGGAVTTLLMGALALVGGTAQAAKGGTCEGFTATVGGQSFTGETRLTIPAAQVGDTITLTGTYVTFSVVASTFEARDYTLTGVNSPRPDKDLPLDAPSVVFISKLPQHGDNLNGPLDLRLSAESVVLERAGASQDMKIQAKDCAQGGIFQMEPEPGTVEVNTLGPDYRYTQVGPEGRLCGTHVGGLFSFYDSPELATLVSNTPTQATWDVQSGGRVGFVVGEDAVEGGCNPQAVT
jgi:hypothetical protein